ncbi:hypothetical protein BLNAU_8072 [Blattamonas nauphoetae]|uniref:Uncharacterized protein n=1 Tax=Blattamonas nauphoetae TaxID=2049346 RepID=A0ABQ9XZT9_9EUKA|nr:hypothetical protein BLNAU_8072 [Blattamonas nauphoetae]
MKMVYKQLLYCSIETRLSVIKADLIPQLITSLNLQSLSLTEAVDIRANLTQIISRSLILATPDCLEELGSEDGYEQQAVHETVLKQVLAPSEKMLILSLFDRELTIVE